MSTPTRKQERNRGDFISVQQLAKLWMLDAEAQRRTLLVAIEVFDKFNAYVDESVRTDRDTKQWLCCVTAYAAPFDSWIQAEIEWQKVLDFFEVSELHLTDFLSRKAEFQNDWSDEKRNLFMERLCTIASERPVMGVGCAIGQSDWETGLSDSLRGEWKDPYYFCLYGMLSLFRSEALREPSKLPLPLFFPFDNKPKFEGAALKIYREYQTAYDPKEEIFDGIAFGSRKKYKPLQIADLLVGLINRRFEEMTRAVDPELSKIKKPLDLLFKREILISFPTAKLLKQFPEFAQRRSLRV
jgi:hypothetical protein